MSAQVQLQSVDASGHTIVVTFVVVLSGSYVVGGDPLNFTPSGTLPVIQDPAYVGVLAEVESSNLLFVSVDSQGGGFVNGANTTNYSPVATKTGTPPTVNPQTGVKLKVGALNTYGTEHSASSYEAAYTSDTITGVAVFTKLL